jgi:hypothetical protein
MVAEAGFAHVLREIVEYRLIFAGGAPCHKCSGSRTDHDEERAYERETK